MRRSVPPLVSCEWLANELKRSGRKRLKIIDSTWFLPNSPFKNVTELTAEELFSKKRIPGAVFLDIDRIGDPSFTQLKVPHNLPRDASFLREMLNLRSEEHAIVYDQLGIFSSPRGMFTLEAFGHVNVSVLDGGLPMWLKLGFPVEIGDDEKMVISKRTESVTPSSKKKRKTKRTDLQWSLKDVQDNIVSQKYQLVDVRPSPRYNGKMKESRPNTRSGHVPGSFNVPFISLLRDVKNKNIPTTLESKNAIALRFREAGVQLDEKIAFMCGSGLTACIGKLALEHIGFEGSSSPVYDGSWAEYGSNYCKTTVHVPTAMGGPGF